MTNTRTEPQVAATRRMEQTMSAITAEHVAFPVHAARRRPAREQAPLHLTARGRRVVTVLAVVLALVVGLVGGRASASSPERGLEVDLYTVGAGETLWSIATAHAAPGADVRDVVDELMSLNELSGPSLVAGQQLVVPADQD